MSLFLIYFEVGEPVPPSPVPARLQHLPVSVTFKGRSGPARPGLVLTDGGSSAAFLAFGNKGVAREGEALRAGLIQFVRQRLEMGAHPHFVFHWVAGSVKTASVDIENLARVPILGMEDKLRALAGVAITDSSEVIEATADAEEAAPTDH